MNRYARNIVCEGVGEEGQRRLATSSVFVLGCGALGSNIAMLLAGAGVGKITIADFDTIDISNLQRQLFFSESQQGELKADVLRQRMQALNSEVSVEIIPEKVTEELAESLFEKYDFILDGSDNPATKYMTDAVCERLGKPCCIGGVSGWNLQLMTILPGTTRYSTVFPPQPTFKEPALRGVMGPTPMACASLMAQEALKYLLCTGTLLTDHLLHLDTLHAVPLTLQL